MATKTSPRRPARTIIESASAVAERPESHFREQFETPEKPEVVGEMGFVALEPGMRFDLKPDTVSIEIPVAEMPTEGYVKRFNNIDCRLTEDGHKAAFQKLYYGLNQTHTQLACGKHIDNPSDVVKYLLEQFTLSLAGS